MPRALGGTSAATRSPPMKISPEVGRSSPAIIRSRVVLPHPDGPSSRSEEHTSELQSQSNLVCRLLLEKKKKTLAYLASSQNMHQTTLSILHTTTPLLKHAMHTSMYTSTAVASTTY